MGRSCSSSSSRTADRADGRKGPDRRVRILVWRPAGLMAAGVNGTFLTLDDLPIDVDFSHRAMGTTGHEQRD